MPGVVTLLTPAKASGFALHPQVQGYPVLVHVVHKRRILCSCVADRPPPSNRDQQSACWFQFQLAEFGLSYLDLRTLSFLIGETDELLDVARVTRKPKPSAKTPMPVEDLMDANVRRHWITGATYLDAERVGVSEADIIDLLYFDILGRRADPAGLANYLTHRREGSKSLGDIRKELLGSEEYAARRKEAAWAPGAIFSQPIVLLTTPAAIEAEAADADAVGPAAPDAADGAATPAPSKAVPADVLARSRPHGLARTGRRRKVPEIVEIALLVDSVLFAAGWYDVEYLNETPFRWMAASGVIFNPQPELACTRVSLQLAGVYGAHMPMVDCYFDDITAHVRVEEQGAGFALEIVPPDAAARPYSRLRIESRVSGCPVAEERGTDQRILSLNLVSARIAYRSASH